ncbi:hypothetical protein EV361DRAFT_904206 [Lentinula raphanica]|nr:hypothetical protein EV361DRAFT_904206 [Lentinula raphanica]
MRSLPLRLHLYSRFLSLLPLSSFACLIRITTAASIPPTVPMRTTGLRVRAPPTTPANAGYPSLKLPSTKIQLHEFCTGTTRVFIQS